VRIVVTGAGGLTGSCVTGLLLDAGHRVTTVVRSREGASRIDPRAEVALADCADPHQLRPAVEGADALIHLAGIKLADAVAVAASVEPSHVIAVSTASVLLPGHPMAETFARHEATLRSRRPDATVVRPTMIYGSTRDRNVHNVVRFAHRWRFLPLPASDRGRVQPVHYADLAQVLVALVTAERGITLAAGGPVSMDLKTAGTAVFAALRQRPRFVRVPVGPISAAFEMVSARWAERLSRSLADRSVDADAMTRLTGVMPRSFESGVAGLVAEMRLSGAI
jgi:uncharacterized protein YbjT (DUF2867 family)